MSQISNLCHCAKIGLFFLLLILGSLSASAQFEAFQIKVGDTIAEPGELNAVISIYMKNYTDTVAGFDFLLLLDRPDIMEFQTRADTIVDTSYWRCLEWDDEVCLDSMDITDSVLIEPSYEYDWISIDHYPVWSANIDTTGTLCSGWEYVRCNAHNSDGHGVTFSARSSYYGPPYAGGIGYPPAEDVPLIKILANVYDIPPEQEDRSVNILIQQNCTEFSFENPCKFFYDESGAPIGWEIVTDTSIDTTCFNCDLWNETGDTCYVWTETDESFGDSCYCCDTILIGHIDSSNIAIYGGYLVVAAERCSQLGDVDGDGVVNLLDITALIQYMYKDGPVPPCIMSADMNNTSTINLLDLVALIRFLYPH